MSMGYSRDLVTPAADIVALAFLPPSGDGTLDGLVSGSRDGTVRLWNHNRFVKTVMHTPEEVWGLSVAPDSGVIAVCGKGSEVQRYYSMGGDVRPLKVKSAESTAVACGAENRYAVSASGGTYIYHIDRLEAHHTFDFVRWAKVLAYSPDYKQLAVGSMMNLTIINCVRHLPVHRRSTQQVLSVSWFPQGDRLAYSEVMWPDSHEPRSPVYWAYVYTPEIGCTQEIPAPDVALVAVTPDGNHIVTATLYGCIRVFEAESLKQVNMYAFARQCYSLAISPSSNTIAIGMDSGAICFRPLRKQ